MGHLSSLSLLLLLVAGTFASQRYSVKGKLLCKDKPAKGIQVKLLDADGGIMNGNDHMDEGETEANGEFLLYGEASDVGSTIDPYLKIYHKCDVPLTQICATKLKWRLPTSGYAGTHKVYDFGTFNLQVKMDDTETDCIH